MPLLYRGVWPQNVSSLSKYAVRFVDGAWKVTVQYEADQGLRFLAVEGGTTDLHTRVNDVKASVGESPGGAFYVNEYRHVIVPVRGSADSGTGSHYYYAGTLSQDFAFHFEGRPLSTRPERPDGAKLEFGERWVGPRPGIPYKLAAGGADIYFESPALTDGENPSVRPNVTRKVKLSLVLQDKAAVARAVRGIAQIRGHSGGRFYVNEHGAMFTPVGAGDGNGLDYVFCGSIERSAWFPSPVVPIVP
jgi:hypothetical protein